MNTGVVVIEAEQSEDRANNGFDGVDDFVAPRDKLSK